MKVASFGEYVTAAQQVKGLSDRQLGTIVGVAHTSIGRIVGGSVPAPKLLVALVDALDMDIAAAMRLIPDYQVLYERIAAYRKEGL